MSEVYEAVGQKGHMLLIIQIRDAYFPDEIRNSTYVSTSDEKSSHRGHRGQTPN